MITLYGPQIRGTWRAALGARKTSDPGTPRHNFPAACPSDWMLGPQTWGWHHNIYLPDLDSKPVCDLNIVSISAGWEDGGQSLSLVMGEGGMRSIPRNVCDKVSVCVLYFCCRALSTCKGDTLTTYLISPSPSTSFSLKPTVLLSSLYAGTRQVHSLCTCYVPGPVVSIGGKAMHRTDKNPSHRSL